uniref:Uncharacterized protein n=1 Tax=Arundo donax TaxID=35708 RepID=A0A0A9A726_ARUDO
MRTGSYRLIFRG